MGIRRSTLAKLIALRLMLGSASAEPDDARPEIELRERLTVSQQGWWDAWKADDLDAQALLCGRRAGKSTLFAYWLVDGAIKAPRGSWCVYVSITREHAEQAMWQQIKDAATESGAAHSISETKLRIRFAGGGMLMLAGCDTKREINKFRSKKIARVAVDECGALRASLLQYLDEDVLEPACMDLGGKRAYGGTPGPFPLGWWWDLTQPRKNLEPAGGASWMPVGRWTARENPHIVGGAETYFERVRKRRGWLKTHPTYVREYEGQWYVDVGELVFPIKVGRNTIEALPTHTDAGAVLDPTRWRYAIGIDLGFVHASAFVVVAAHPGLAERMFVVESEKHVGWITQQIRDRLRQLRKKYPQSLAVADSGGYGKPIVEELKSQWGEALEPAEKTHKAGQIRLIRDAIIGSTLQLLDGEQNDALRSEWRVMGWDPEDPTKPSGLAEDHASDATIYAARALRHYTQTDAPPPLTPAEADAKARADKFKRLEQQAKTRPRHSLCTSIKKLIGKLTRPPTPWQAAA